MTIKKWFAAFALTLLATTHSFATDAAQSPLFVVHFETGPKWDKSLAPADQPNFKEHSANLNRLRKEGAIVFGARYDEFGMIVVKADTLATAKALIDADPGVRSQIFSYRIALLNVFYPWKP
jgi:uncharacterized protein YciI